MRVGYYVKPFHDLASFRLRVSIPASYLTCPYVIGGTGSPTFFYKDGDVPTAAVCKGGVVYDVVNDHFDRQSYIQMTRLADVLTTSSQAMAEVVKAKTGRDATVIDDPYENAEQEPAVVGDFVVWFGHGANISSLKPYADLPNLRVCSNVKGAIPWSTRKEASCIEQAAVVLLTGNNPGASANRLVKAVRAGRFVVAPPGTPAWDELKDYCWIGDVREGIKWALNNREDACQRIAAGQRYMRERFHPSLIGAKWMEVFASTSGAATSEKKDGLVLT